jgi:hypothetical protein
MLGSALGLQIANSIIDPSANPASRAVLIANWIKIANVIVSHIQTTAIVIIPPISAPGAANLTCATAPGPVVGAIQAPPGNIK